MEKQIKISQHLYDDVETIVKGFGLTGNETVIISSALQDWVQKNR